MSRGIGEGLRDGRQRVIVVRVDQVAYAENLRVTLAMTRNEHISVHYSWKIGHLASCARDEIGL